MHSIRRRLLFWLFVTVLAAVVLAGWLIFRQAQAEANELFDYQLEQTAAALPSEPFSSVLGSRTQNDEGVVIQIWSREGVQLYYSHPRAPLAPRAELGFSTERTARGDWRVYSAIVGQNVVQVAQPMSVRTQLAAEVAWRTIWPLLVLLPLLGVLVWVTVGRGLVPLRRVAHALDMRRPEALDPLPDAHLPLEVKPLVRALNGLLTRLTSALDTQKAFVADAAHELRTPLAALQIQLQLLERAHGEDERREALYDLQSGVGRATRLVEQLLALARAEPAAAEPAGATPRRIDLLAVLQDCVARYAPLAAGKQLDLGFETTEAASVLADADGLRVLFGNLLDNALKYSMAPGQIDVSVRTERGAAVVEIVDNGPGIAAAERERVFDRFYRAAQTGAGPGGERTDVQGSGLGLAIVRRIAERYNARVTLGDGIDGRGLRVTVRFPALPEKTPDI